MLTELLPGIASVAVLAVAFTCGYLADCLKTRTPQLDAATEMAPEFIPGELNELA